MDADAAGAARDEPPRRPQEPDPRDPAAHLDEDPEAMEDPVHSGEARHQQEAHAEASRRQGSGQAD